MKTLRRFGVSIERDLLKQFDGFLSRAGYIGRSEAIRDLIRGRLVDEEVQGSGTTAFGVFTFVYDHHKGQLEEKLTDVQHEHVSTIITATHVHIDHDHCLEVILLKGKVSILKEIALTLSSLKGVKHTKLVLTSIQGRDHDHPHPHHHH